MDADLETGPAEKLIGLFAGLTDPRVDHTRRHRLVDIVVITIFAVFAGADDYEAVAEYGVAKAAWLRQFLALPNGIPSHDTFWRVMRALDSVQFERCFRDWIAAAIELAPGEVVALDGKVLRRSQDIGHGHGPLQLVSAWAAEHEVVLGTLRIDAKANEIVAVPELIEQLDITGCLVTTDALSCQVKTAERILAKDADYLLALKHNQPASFADVADSFTDLAASDPQAYAYDQDKDVANGHGRVEIRKAWVIDAPQVLALLPNLQRWPQLRSLIKIESERILFVNGVEQGRTQDARYYISSATGNAAFFNRAVRSHWRIENAAHWVLDVALREDESRLRKDNGPENMAVIRRFLLSLLKQDKSCKLGIKNKRLKMTWDQSYFLHVLSLLMS